MEYTFLLKKFVSFFLTPLRIEGILLLVGLWALLTNRKRIAKFTITLAFAWLFLASYDPISRLLLHPLESHYRPLHDPPSNAKYIYVLGNGHNDSPSLPLSSKPHPEALTRLIEGIRLYRAAGKNAKLILSGYGGLDPNATSHALVLKQLSLALGVSEKDILIVPGAKDTYEEALAAKKIVKTQPCIVVTSASHMSRAMLHFQSRNIHAIAAPTYFRSGLSAVNFTAFLSQDALWRTYRAIHEYLGIIWAYIKNKVIFK